MNCLRTPASKEFVAITTDIVVILFQSYFASTGVVVV